MSRKSYPNVNAANQYARDVVRGKIVACQFVIQACQRHLDDLMAEKSKSFRYRFDKDLAERAAKFIQLLPHTKGEWAFKRMPITLEPWQLFVICCAFGWVNKGTRLRRFREVYTEIPRKNGKSAISAGVALYCFACDNEFGAEVYSGATTEKQAWEVFRPARLMCKRTPMLTEAFGIEVNASNMNRPEDGARFEPLIGNPGDGSSPHCAVVDEYHEHATDALYTTMLTGMGARRQPLMWAITTAGYNIEGPCYDKRREVIEMLNGSVPNDELFGIIYTVDEGDDWTDPQVLEKANPNIGVSVYREFLLSQQQRAKNNARLANVFKTKHLNIWVSARSAYFNLVSWQSCEDKSLTLEQFEGQPCILAFDLARKLDMNSMARLYTREIDGKTHYYSVAPRFWVPYDTVYSVEKNEDRRTAERFQKWVEMGVLTVTDGAEVDYRYILEEAKAANKISPVSESPIDPFGATGLSHDLADEDLNPVTIIQNYTNMSDPMKELEAAIESGRFHHDGNPIMTWCIGNVVGKTIPGTRASNDAQLLGYGEGSRMRERLLEMWSIRHEFEQKNNELLRQYQAGEIEEALWKQEKELNKKYLEERLSDQQDYYAKADALRNNWNAGLQEGLTNWADSATDYASQAADAVVSTMDGLVSNISDALAGNVVDWRNWGSSILQEVSKILMNAAIVNGLKSLSGAGGWLGTVGGWISGAVANAKGGVYTSANLSAYSNTIVDTPTYFAFAKGAGLMGEAGPEAIMPLTRAADGSLGVRAIGNVNSGGGVVYSPVYHISIQNQGSNGEIDACSARGLVDLIDSRVVSIMQSSRRDGGLYSA